jgi:hypothetical protein
MADVIQAQRFGGDATTPPRAMELDLRFSDCPGNARKIVRADRAFAECAMAIKVGDKVPVEMIESYRAERGDYRSEVVKIAGCERHLDPRDEASYDVVEDCRDVEMHGTPLGVHCDRTRNPALLAKCPFFRRK